MGASTLLDRSLESVRRATGDVAVNVHHGREAMVAHLVGRSGVHVSIEDPVALGTAGALAHLRGWLAGRAVLAVNADTVHGEDLASFVAGWDGERVRVLMTGEPPFGPRRGVVASITPWPAVSALRAEPSGLWEVLWRDEVARGRIDAVTASAAAVDCGTPAGYLRANLQLNGGRSVVGDGAVVNGTVERCVVWPGSEVGMDEHLVDAVRAGPHTVLVR